MPDPDPQQFLTTRWSVVLAARDAPTGDAHAALDTLCRSYWYPIYAYVRRRGHGQHDAQDLTQEFFARLLGKAWLQAVDRERGHFRTFLIVALKRFLVNEWQHANRLKRGGDATVISFDTADAESRYRAEPSGSDDADFLYDRRWALTLLDESMTRLEVEFAAAGKQEEFAVLKPALATGQDGSDTGEIAAAMGTSDATARVAIHRIRKRFREIFREMIAQTVADPGEVAGEVRYLIDVLARG